MTHGTSNTEDASVCFGFKSGHHGVRAFPGSEAAGHGENLDQLWELT